jgi:4-amino-4-deoxy-L-arabinose transferase-like glycosyltransferase
VTIVRTSSARHVAQSPWRRRRDLRTPATAVAVGVMVAALRLFRSSTSSDVFVDEVIYVHVGHSLTTDALPTTPDGRFFFLHPPGFFYLAAGWEGLLGSQADLVDAVYQLRLLNAVLAAVTAVALLLVVRRVAALPLATAAALLFAVDAFAVRQNGLALLDTAALMWVVLGYLVLLPLAQSRGSHGLARGAGGGLLFGLAILTKDEAVLLTLVPVVVALALRWLPRRRPVAALFVAAALPYAFWMLGVAHAGHLDIFLDSKVVGLKRMFGVIQVTGFNVPGAPSLAGRLVDEAGYFAPTYLVLTLSLLGFVVVLWHGDAARRLLALFYGGALLLMAVAVFKGALEEQRLYFLLVPSYVILPVGLAVLLERSARRDRILWFAVALALLAVLSGTTTYMSWRTTPDIGYATLRAWMIRHVPSGTAVTAADGSQERGVSYWVLGDRYDVGRWLTPESRRANEVRYLVVPWDVVRQGYSYAETEDVARVADTGVRVLRITSRRYGEIDLYRLPVPEPLVPAPGGGP